MKSSGASLTYRRASIEDVNAMAELRAKSGWTGGAGADTMRRYLIGEHHPQKALSLRVAFVAEDENGLAGFIAGHSTTRFGCAGELQWLLVERAQRGKGIAKSLIVALAKWFAEQKIARVCVNVASENLEARNLYAQLGATDLSEHWMVWDDISASTSLNEQVTRGLSSP